MGVETKIRGVEGIVAEATTDNAIAVVDQVITVPGNLSVRVHLEDDKARETATIRLERRKCDGTIVPLDGLGTGTQVVPWPKTGTIEHPINVLHNGTRIQGTHTIYRQQG